MMSSSGAAVGFAGAKADSTGVTVSGLSVGEGCSVGASVTVGAGEAQAAMIKIANKISRVQESEFFIEIPQEDFKKPCTAEYTVDTAKCPRSPELDGIGNPQLYFVQVEFLSRGAESVIIDKKQSPQGMYPE